MVRIDPKRRAEIGEQKRRRTNGRIVDAALRVIAAKGLDQFSIDDVVTEAGISRGSFYNYYPDKHALVADMADRMHDILASDRYFVPDDTLDMRDNLLAFMRRQALFLRRAHEHSDWGWLIMEVFATQRMARPFLGTQDPEIFFDFMRRLGASGLIAFRSVDAIYDFYIGAMYLTLGRIIRVGDPDVETVIGNFFFHVLLAFGTPRGEVEGMVREALAEPSSVG
ncbi:MAG: TetR/AcrR family transcriptional regulator [Sphingomonadales bacterium]